MQFPVSAQQSRNGIKLRRFPYPFQAALSVSNDRHGIQDTNEFLQMHRFLNTSHQTPYGPGLNLDITDSFWFYDQLHKFSYFADYSDQPSEQAPYIRELIQCGLIDALHTWGDFSTHKFEKKYAEYACKEMLARNIQVPVWINHGDRNNTQNINCGVAYHQGAVVDSICYHAPILKEISIKYFWRYLTPLVGQQRKITCQEFQQSTDPNRSLFSKYRRRVKWNVMQLNQAFGSPFDFYDDIGDNRLLREVELDDGSQILEFRRFNNHPDNIWLGVDAPDIHRQISRGVLDALEQVHGYLVVYNHLEQGDLYTPENLATLRDLSQRFHRGRIWVAGLAGLLNYCHTHFHLKWSESVDGDKNIAIDIEDSFCDALGNRTRVTKESLAGITFDIPARLNVKFLLAGKLLELPLISESEVSRLYGLPVTRAEFPTDMLARTGSGV